MTTRIKRAGAVLIGRTNLHEFAFGTTTEDSGFGLARHPVDETRSPGGSSGGSGIAVRTGMSIASIGTDTGGSIRIPAAACGVVGLKPTWGEIPADGVVPLSRQLDHVGPIARTVTDAWLLHHVLAGRMPSGDAQLTPATLAGARVGLLDGYFWNRMAPEVEAAAHAAVESLRRAGAIVEPVTIPHAADMAAVYLHLVLADAAAYHAATLERRPDDYTPGVRLRLEMGRYVLAEDYARAMRGREIIASEIDAALDGRAALVCPDAAHRRPADRRGDGAGAWRRRTGAHRHVAAHAALQPGPPAGDLAALRHDPRGPAGRTAAGRPPRRNGTAAPVRARGGTAAT